MEFDVSGWVRLYNSKRFSGQGLSREKFSNSQSIVVNFGHLQVYYVTAGYAEYYLIHWLLRICSPRSDLRGHVTDGKTQFSPSVSSYWLVGQGANQGITKWRANPTLERQMHEFFANFSTIST